LKSGKVKNKINIKKFLAEGVKAASTHSFIYLYIYKHNYNFFRNGIYYMKGRHIEATVHKGKNKSDFS
jgi:hypothetical protein